MGRLLELVTPLHGWLSVASWRSVSLQRKLLVLQKRSSLGESRKQPDCTRKQKAMRCSKMKLFRLHAKLFQKLNAFIGADAFVMCIRFEVIDFFDSHRVDDARAR